MAKSSFIQKNRKALGGSGVALFTALTYALGDGKLSAAEMAGLAGSAVLGYFGVWFMPPNIKGGAKPEKPEGWK